jgi:hypothetical protein
MRTEARWISRVGVVSLVALAMTVASPGVHGQAQHVRWDIVSQNFPPASPLTTSAGGIASARAIDGSQITLTGSGTFVAPGGPGGGTSSAVTGGGTWTICSAPANPGCVSGVSGTYEVTGLVRWEPAPYPPGNPSIPRIDLIDEGGVRSTGLAVLRIIYSDGDRGILVVSCEGVTSPSNMFEGITASKGFVEYWSPVPPVGGVNANRTLFHIE